MKFSHFYRVDLRIYSTSKLNSRYQHQTSYFVKIKSYETTEKAEQMAIELYKKESPTDNLEIEVHQVVGPLVLYHQE